MCKKEIFIEKAKKACYSNYITKRSNRPQGGLTK